MQVSETKSRIEHPLAKRLMVVFMAVLLTGVVMVSVHQTDLSVSVLEAGIIGFFVSAWIASPAKAVAEQTAKKHYDGGSWFDLVKELISEGWQIVIIGACIYGLVAFIKWCWIHS
jgi:hypothetical protein